jgi:hypothetical protein
LSGVNAACDSIDLSDPGAPVATLRSAADELAVLSVPNQFLGAVGFAEAEFDQLRIARRQANFKKPTAS